MRSKNKDYAGDSELLKASHVYIENDIKILQPDYIIMPKVNDSAFLKQFKDKTIIIDIYQINGTVVNNMASENGSLSKKYFKVKPEDLPDIIREYYEEISGINHI